MPIKKFKTFEDAALDNIKPFPDKKYYDQVRNFFNLFEKLLSVSKKRSFRGIIKFKDFASAERHKEESLLHRETE